MNQPPHNGRNPPPPPPAAKPEIKTLIASSRVTLLCNLPVPESAMDAGTVEDHKTCKSALFGLLTSYSPCGYQCPCSWILKNIQDFMHILDGIACNRASSHLAEDLASYGALLASGNNKVAGIQLCINHVKSAVIGDLVFAEATPVKVGKSVQVWNVCISKCHPSNTEIKTLISASNVTLFCNFGASQQDEDTVQGRKEHAKM